MKLYYFPGACSLSPHIVAVEAGLSTGLEKVDLKTHKTESGGDYSKINPRGYVPALELDDGTMLFEGPAIALYLADRKPAMKLAPAEGTPARYQLISWLAFIGTEIHKQFAPMFQGGTDIEQVKAKKKIAARFDYVNGELAGKTYLLGDDFTVADAYLFVMLTWATKTGIDMPGNVKAYYTRIAKRPAVQQALASEGAQAKAA